MPTPPIVPLNRLQVRRLPARQFEPPYDETRYDETRADAIRPQRAAGRHVLPFPLPSGAPAVPEAPRALRLVPPLPPDRPADGPPDPAGWAGRLVQALVEVIAGDRPAAQLVRWTSAPVYAGLQHRSREVPVAGRAGRAGRVGPPARATRTVVTSVRVNEPRPGVAEVCAVVRRGGRARAIALRLEATGPRWLCTALHVG